MTTYYILVSVKDEPDGMTSVAWHKHLYLMLEQAAKAALEMGSHTHVIALEQNRSFTHEWLREEFGDKNGM